MSSPWRPPTLRPLDLPCELPAPVTPPPRPCRSRTEGESPAGLSCPRKQPEKFELSSDDAFWEMHDELKELGKGSYGTVKLIRVRSNGNLVAVKAISKGTNTPEEGIDENREADVLSMFRRTNSLTAPARIGGRRSSLPARPSLFELQDRLSGSAELKRSESARSLRSLQGGLLPASPLKGTTMSPRTVVAPLAEGDVEQPDWEALAAEDEERGEEEEDATSSTSTSILSSVEETGADGGELAEPSDVVSLLDVYETPCTRFLVMKAELGGDMAAWLAAQPGGISTEHQARDHAKVLLRAIEGMHRQGVVHRDIKAANVLFSQDGTSKIGDFGLAERMPEGGGLLTSVCGTHNNRAPEMVLCGHDESPGYGTPADMWQAGILLFEALFGEHPFARATEIETLSSILSADFSFPPPPPGCAPVSGEARELICRLLVTDPSVRLTATESLSHAWLSQKV